MRVGVKPKSRYHDHTVAIKKGTLTLSATLPIMSFKQKNAER